MQAKISASPSVKVITSFLLLCALVSWATPSALAEALIRPFGTGDLAGTWSVHGIVVGKSPGQHPGWFHCQITFDANGRGVWSPIVDSEGNQVYLPAAVTWTVGDDGAVSWPGGPAFQGIMNQKRDRVVVVATMAPGRQGSAQGDNLIIMQKQSGVVFATGDLEGTWSMHVIDTADPPTWPAWMHGDMTIDHNGMFLEVPGCSRDSMGYSPGTGNGAMSLTREGVLVGTPFSFIHDPHGTVSDDKDLGVITLTDTHMTPSAVYGLGTIQRRSDAPFAKRDLSGEWRICGLSTQGGKWSNWVQGTWTVNADGSSEGRMNKSDGTTSPLAGTVTMASYGVFRLDPFAYTHGVVGSDRDLLLLVTTDFQGEHQMLVGTRMGAAPVAAGPCPCQDDDPVNGIYRICNYWPLHPGNQWVYTTGDYTVLNETYTSTFGWSAVRLGTRTYHYDMFLHNCEHGLAYVAYQNLCDGTFAQLDPLPVLIPPEMRIGTSFRVDKTDLSPGGAPGPYTMTTTCVGLETITVPAGKFTALRFDVEINDIGKGSYTMRLWFVKNLGMAKFHRVNASPADYLGCIFTCRCDDNLVLRNAPAELVSAIVDGKRY